MLLNCETEFDGIVQGGPKKLYLMTRHDARTKMSQWMQSCTLKNILNSGRAPEPHSCEREARIFQFFKMFNFALKDFLVQFTAGSFLAHRCQNRIITTVIRRFTVHRFTVYTDLSCIIPFPRFFW